MDCQAEGGLPGYSFALMVIHFLQAIEPPVLPRLPTEVRVIGLFCCYFGAVY